MKSVLGQAGNNLMDRWARWAPQQAVVLSGHLLFWPIVFSQYTLSKLGLFDWYTVVWNRPREGTLFLGALPWPGSLREHLVRKDKISCAVNLVGEKSRFVPEKWTETLMEIPLPDFFHPSFDQLAPGIAFIDGAIAEGKNVYVHCRAGKGRSATLVAAWLVNRRGFTPGEAQAYLSARRPQVLSNLAQRQVVLDAFNKRQTPCQKQS